jgi:isopentenyldiphosphate isomerase
MNTIIVDEHDNPIGVKESDTLDYEDIYRVTALWLTDRATGDMLLAQRKWTKRNDPGKWIAAVAGTVDEGETYEINIAKETEEEIGLTGLNLQPGPKQYVDDGQHKFFCQWYRAEVDKNRAHIVIQEDEIEAIRWISRADLLEDTLCSVHGQYA